MWRVTIDVIFAIVHEKRHVHDRWHKSGFAVCACLTDVCVPHKLQTQWLDWCNGSGNGKYSSDDCSGAKTINVYMRFIKCNSCTGRLHLVLFHHCFWNLAKCSANTCWLKGIGLSSFKQISLPTSAPIGHHCGWRKQTTTTTKKRFAQTLSPTEEINPANHVWVSWLFFHLIRRRWECALTQWT